VPTIPGGFMHTRMSRRASLLAASLITAAAFTGGAAAPAAAGKATPSVAPTVVPGNPTCESLGYAHGLKFDTGAPGTYSGKIGSGKVEWSTDGKSVDWKSTVGIDAVLVKGGPMANHYKYDPPKESYGDKGLTAPVNPKNKHGKTYGVSHVTFCYDYDVLVKKTAKTSFERTYNWKIHKKGDKTKLVLDEGKSAYVNYEVKVGLDKDKPYTDAKWAVRGNIYVKNPDPKHAAKITAVTDVVSPNIAANVKCGVTFPYTLAPGSELKCSYGPVSLPDGSWRKNTATVTTAADSKVGGATGTAKVKFRHPSKKIDYCVKVSDDKYGELGWVCADKAPKTFSYKLKVGPYEKCGDYKFTNKASFVTKDLKRTGHSSWTVDVKVECPKVCPLTQGYWKTHSKYGPATPADPTWSKIGASGEDTTFFKSGKSYYDVLWTPPQGNAYYILAHQYIAAKLNVLNGAGTTAEVNAAIAAAEAFFTAKSPSDSLTNAERQQVLAWAELLDKYNNGLIGPGYCAKS
jgi:hypothetical protein